jgi:Domain of unknown function (DUF4129)
MSVIGWLPRSATVPPLDPTAQQAKAQFGQELANPQYQAAKPTLLDTIIQDVLRWIGSLFNGNLFAPGFDATPLIVGAIVLLVLIAAFVGYLIFGRPRINARRKAAGALFGEEDDRDASGLRRDAERAAAAGDYTTAIEDAFRAIARGLSERTVLTTFPGTTAHGFATEAAASFPNYAAQLVAAANSFDGVRYLGFTGTEPEWLAVSELERELRSAKPVFAEATL